MQRNWDAIKTRLNSTHHQAQTQYHTNHIPSLLSHLDPKCFISIKSLLVFNLTFSLPSCQTFIPLFTHLSLTARIPASTPFTILTLAMYRMNHTLSARSIPVVTPNPTPRCLIYRTALSQALETDFPAAEGGG